MASKACRLVALVVVFAVAPLVAGAEPAAPAPEGKPAVAPKPVDGQPAVKPADEGKPAEPGTPDEEGKPAEPGTPAEGEKPADPAKPTLKAGPSLQVVGVRTLEILPRDYEATLRFYVEVLGFKEEEASGGQGERKSTLSAGPLRLLVREQPGQPARPKRFPWLGIHPAPLGDTAAEAAGLKQPKGVLIEDVVPQGPAGAAGLVKGDIILAVEGKEAATPEALTTAVRALPVGKKALVTVWRERKKQDIPVELTPSPFPDQLSPIALRLEVRELDAFYREVLARGGRVYAEPQDSPDGGRQLEIVDPNDVMVILEEPRADGQKPPATGKPPAGEKPAEEPPALPAPPAPQPGK